MEPQLETKFLLLTIHVHVRIQKNPSEGGSDIIVLVINVFHRGPYELPLRGPVPVVLKKPVATYDFLGVGGDPDTLSLPLNTSMPLQTYKQEPLLSGSIHIHVDAFFVQLLIRGPHLPGVGRRLTGSVYIFFFSIFS